MVPILLEPYTQQTAFQSYKKQFLVTMCVVRIHASKIDTIVETVVQFSRLTWQLQTSVLPTVDDNVNHTP